MHDLRSVLSSIAEQVAAKLSDGDVRRRVTAMYERLAEPLRVAVAGRVSAGKSTLVNALLAQRVLPVGAGECTRVVTWLRYAEVDEAVLALVNGERRTLELGTTRSLPAEFGTDLESVECLDVRLYNDALKELTLIDTPGLESLSPGVSARTIDLLGRASVSAVTEADALIYVIAGDLHDDDATVIEDFSHHAELAGATAANTVLAVTKVDRVLDAPDEDGGLRLEEMLGRWRERLGARVCAVTPVIGLLGEATESGRIDEASARALRELGSIDRTERERWLRSPRLYIAEGTIPADPRLRSELVRALGVFGLRRAADLSELGVTGAGPLGRELAELSGIAGLRHLISAAFTERTVVLKADVALRTLRALTEAPETPPRAAAVIRDALAEHADGLVAVPEAQRLRELELLRLVASGALDLPAPLRADVHRIATGATFRQRLDLPTGATPEEGSAAAASAAARWRRFGFDGRRRPEERRAAHVIGLALAGIARDLRPMEAASKS
jgi:predicted GTPase